MPPLLKRGGRRSAPLDPACVERTVMSDECCTVLVCEEVQAAAVSNSNNASNSHGECLRQRLAVDAAMSAVFVRID